jgi:hypothetical protein
MILSLKVGNKRFEFYTNTKNVYTITYHEFKFRCNNHNNKRYDFKNDMDQSYYIDWLIKHRFLTTKEIVADCI